MQAPATGPGKRSSWARRSFSALPPALPPSGHAAHTGNLKARKSSWQKLGLQGQQTWLPIPALLWGLRQVTLPLWASFSCSVPQAAGAPP